MEEHGIATVAFSAMRDVTEAVRAPRAVMLKSPFGSPMGRSKDAAKQTAVLKAALRSLKRPMNRELSTIRESAIDG